MGNQLEAWCALARLRLRVIDGVVSRGWLKAAVREHRYTDSENLSSLGNRWLRLGDVINGGRPAEADYQVHFPGKRVARGCQIGGELVELAASLS